MVRCTHKVLLLDLRNHTTPLVRSNNVGTVLRTATVFARNPSLFLFRNPCNHTTLLAAIPRNVGTVLGTATVFVRDSSFFCNRVLMLCR